MSGAQLNELRRCAKDVRRLLNVPGISERMATLLASASRALAEAGANMPVPRW
jgi:hypothetical protein